MSLRNFGAALLHVAIPLLCLMHATPALAQLSASVANKGTSDAIFTVYDANNAIKQKAIAKAGGVIGIAVQSGDRIAYSLPSGAGGGTAPITRNGMSLEIPADNVQYSISNNSTSDTLKLSFKVPVALRKRVTLPNDAQAIEPFYQIIEKPAISISPGGVAGGVVPRGSSYTLELVQGGKTAGSFGGSLIQNLNYVHTPANANQPAGNGNVTNVPNNHNLGAVGVGQGAQGASLDGVWLKGPPGMQNFENEIAIVLYLKETNEGLEMRTAENDIATFYPTGQTPRQTYVGKFATVGGKRFDISSFGLQVTSATTMIQTANNNTYHLRKAPANFAAAPKVALKVDGIWRKLPPGQTNFDPNAGFNVTMKTVPGGVGMTIEGVGTAYYANMGTNSYSGAMARGQQGEDVSPADIKAWRIFQLDANRMIQVGTKGTKYYLFKVGNLPAQAAAPQPNPSTIADPAPNVNLIGQPNVAPQVPATTGSNMTQQEAASMLAVHNQERALVGVAPIQWSASLAQSAQAWANQIANRGWAGHAPGAGNTFGENIAEGGRFQFVGNQRIDIVQTPVEAAQSWASEKQTYVAGSPFNGNAGHYTQMVWRGSTQMGCGKAEYMNNGIKYAVYVARYNPPGNRFGAKPY